MKTLKTALAILAVLAVTAGIHVSAAADEKKAEGVLQVHVTIPPTPSPNAEYDVGDRFTAIMSDTFRGLGYDGDIEWIKNLDEPKPDWPLLRVNITHWERRPTGNLEVRFSATLEAAGKTHSLGSYFRHIARRDECARTVRNVRSRRPRSGRRAPQALRRSRRNRPDRRPAEELSLRFAGGEY